VRVAGPLIGGILATFVGSRWIFVVGCAMLLASLVPLFRSAEPVKTRQTLRFRDLPLDRVKYDLFAGAGTVVENTLCINLWPFYIAVFALSGEVYGKLGVLASLAMLTSIFTAVILGRYVDTQNARLLLRASASLNALLHLMRPLVHSLFPAFAVGVTNEVVTTGYRMPFMKGMYAAADDLPGFRIVYVTYIELLGDILKSTTWFLLAIVALQTTNFVAFCVGFAVAAAASFAITGERFKALDSSRVL
jgi:MFS family permease